MVKRYEQLRIMRKVDYEHYAALRELCDELHESLNMLWDQSYFKAADYECRMPKPAKALAKYEQFIKEQENK